MRTIFLFLLAAALLLSGCSTTPPPQTASQPTFKPVGDVLQIMQGMVIPAADVVWKVPAEAPKNDEEWAAVQHSALILAESGNLLMIGDRAKDQDAWMKASQALVDAGTAAFRGAEAKNVEALMMAGDAIYNACEGCHMKYPPQTGKPQ